MTTFVGALLIFSITASLYTIRTIAEATAKEHSRTAAEIVRVSLTESMLNGVINKREAFLQRIATVEGLQDAKVIRSPMVSQQFGTVSDETPDLIEEQVMQTGQAYFKLDDEYPVFRATIPYIAGRDDNCRQCHQVPVNTVLGVVTTTISVEKIEQQGMQLLILIVVVLTLVSGLFLWLFRRQLNPVIDTSESVQDIVQRAKSGKFSGRIVHKGNDEVAQMAKDLNYLMEHLEEQLGETCRDIAKLMQYELPSDSDIDLLKTTTEMVNSLIEVSQFKMDVEDDHSKQEVYQHISRVLIQQFNLHNFSLYECTASDNTMIPVIVDGELDDNCKWCDPDILKCADRCRALRTGNMVDSSAKPGICSLFRNNGDEQLKHICIPVIQTGTVGSIIQLTFDEQVRENIYAVLHLILVYLRESSSVVEAKRLMDKLRESAIKDALTGLRNRRFLDDYLPTLLSTVARKNQQLSILMMDLDKFKEVNDTYGHDAGDIVLKALSTKLESLVRSADIVVRYGGEEFMVILQETTDATYYGMTIAEKIRAAVEAMEIQLPNKVLKKTISIGVANFPEDHEDFWEAAKLADQALYEAKDTGRNKVVNWKELKK